jgi:hypothetical protein
VDGIPIKPVDIISNNNDSNNNSNDTSSNYDIDTSKLKTNLITGGEKGKEYLYYSA